MPVTIARATPADEPLLRQLMHAMPVEGWVRVRYEREPDFFAAASVEGRRVDVILARDPAANRVLGFGTRSEKRCYVNGQPSALGYLGSLRVAPAFRQGTLLARGYKFLRELDRASTTNLYLTTITEDNHPAEAVLPSGRAGLPTYRPYGRYSVYALSSRVKLPAPAPAEDALDVRTATPDDVPAILALFQATAQRRQFFPVYEAQDLLTNAGLLRGFPLSNLHLAFRGEHLAGTLGLWNQQAFKQQYVDGYNGPMRYLRWAYNGWAQCTGRLALPNAGAKLNSACLALASIDRDDPTVFRALLRAVLSPAMANRAASRETMVLAGFHDRDPLCAEVARLPHVAHHNRLYLVSFDATRIDAVATTLPAYLELGGL